MKASAKLQNFLLAGLMTAITAICSWINIGLFFTPIPINLALMGPYISGLLLGSRYGVLSQTAYVLMGAFGLPVFAGFASGVGVLAGPTGGFIAGYVLCSAICGLSVRKKGTKHRLLLMLLGLTACYVCGLIWFMFVTGAALWAALVSCVFPFLLGDAVKIALTALLTKHLSNALKI